MKTSPVVTECPIHGGPLDTQIDERGVATFCAQCRADAKHVDAEFDKVIGRERERIGSQAWFQAALADVERRRHFRASVFGWCLVGTVLIAAIVVAFA